MLRRASTLAAGVALVTAGLFGAAGCANGPLVDDVRAHLRGDPGAVLTGAPRGLGAPEVLNRRDLIYAVAFDDDARALAFTHHVTTHMQIGAFDLEPARLRFDERINENEFDADDVVFVDDAIVTTSRQGVLRAFDRASGRLLRELACGEALVRVARSPDRALLALSTADGRVLVVDSRSFALLGGARLHRGEARGVAFLPDGRLVTVGDDATAKLVRVDDDADGAAAVRVTFAPQPGGARVFLAHIDGRRAIATVRDPRQSSTVVSRAAAIRLGLANATTTPTRTVATAEGPVEVPVVDVGAVHVQTLALGPIAAAVCDACVPPGAELVLGADVLAGLSVVEDVASSEFVVRSTSTAGALVPGARRLVEERTLALPGPGTDVDVNGWGQVLVSFSATPAERSFEINEAEKQGRFPDPSTRSGAALIDVPTFSLGRAFVGGHRGFTVTGALSPDGRVVVTGGWDRRVIVWDARTGEFVTERSLAWLVRRVRVAPTGDRVAVAAWTPVSVDGDSEPALLLYPLELADVSIAARP